MRSASRTDTGRVRRNNEDSLLADDSAGVYIVADGMGGARGGEVASALAVATLSSRLRRDSRAGMGREEIRALLVQSLAEAHEAIATRAAADSDLTGMGTTVMLALRDGGSLHLAHVGDSRAYLLRDAAIRRLTEDHSVLAELLKSGTIPPEQARTHRLRHMLTQALGTSPAPVPDVGVVEPLPGDMILLCSDGLTEMLDDDQILACAAAPDGDLQAACSRLVDRANAAGGRDNVSVILLLETPRILQ